MWWEVGGSKKDPGGATTEPERDGKARGSVSCDLSLPLHAFSTKGLGDQSSGDLKSDHVISRLSQSTQGLKGFQDLILSIFLPPDQIGLTPVPKSHLEETAHWGFQPFPTPGVHVGDQYTASRIEALSIPKPGLSPSVFDCLSIPKGCQGRFSSITQSRKLSFREVLCLS